MSRLNALPHLDATGYAFRHRRLDDALAHYLP